MKTRLLGLFVACAACLSLSGSLLAMGIADLDPTDLNSITLATVDPAHSELLTFEDYNETRLIAYPSHDGYAIVNPAGGYFDKIVTYQQADVGGPWAFDFRVTNTSPYTWSDYHFEFWDAAFQNRLKLAAGVVYGWSSSIFQNSSFDGSVLEFWAPNWQVPGQTNQLLFFVNNLQNVAGAGPASFGIRQVATTVPEPLTMLGLFAGVSALGGYLRRRRMP
jgi:hypothetical protein